MESLATFFVVETVVAVFALISIKNHIARIADKLEMHESNWSKGYTRGYADAKREFGIDEECDT